MEEANNLAKNVGNSINDMFTKSSDGIKSAVVNLTQSSGILIGLIVVIIVAAVCAAIIYWIIVKNVFQKLSATVEATKTPINGNVTSVIPIQTMPMSENGFRRTITFWIYLNDMNNGTGQYKRVFYVGSQNEAINTASPMIFLGKSKNEMHIRFGKTMGENFASSSSLQLSDASMNSFLQQGVTLEYVPMQRWVHIGIVVTESVNGGMIQVYVDADLAVVANDGDKFVGVDLSTSNVRSLNNLNLDKTGNLIIGSDGKTTNDVGFNGLISKVTFYNYDLNARDIYDNYIQGPIDGILTSLGYGVRSPIYKL